jgi:hypothetical protein
MAATVAVHAPASRDAPKAKPAGTAIVVLSVLCLQFLIVGLWQARHDALAVDEAVDVSSGVTSLVRHDLRLNPEHGPLPKALAALPALLAHPVVPDSAAYDETDWFDYTHDFVRANEDAGRLDDVVFLARLVPLLLGVGCALLLFRLGSALFGTPAGAVASGLWLTTPVFVGFAHFAMIDVPFTFAVLLACECLRRHLVAPSPRSLLWLGCALAAALLTRHLALAFLAAVVVFLAARQWRSDRRAGIVAAAAVLLVSFAGIWIGVRVIAPTPLSGQARSVHESIVDTAASDSVLASAVASLPLPLEYQAGVGYLTLTSEPRPSYLFGQSWDGGRLWFFPGSLVTKLPIGALALLAATPFAWRAVDPSRRRLAATVVLAPALLMFALLLVQPLNLGLRLAFPTVALLFVAAGPLAAWLWGRRGGRALLAALALTQLVAFWEATPHSLAWTAPPFRPAYRWVSDSNVDFGQDRDRLVRWTADRVARGEDVWVSQVMPRGAEPPAGSHRLLDADPTTIRGWVAVGATSLSVVNADELAWLRAYCPVDDIGGSILIYRFDEPPVVTAGPSMPAVPCPGGASHLG